MQLDRPFVAVTSTVDGDVLAALARVDTTLSVAQLRTVVGRYSGEGIRRSLARLVDQGVVRQAFAGNAAAYGLNRDHLIADCLVTIANTKTRFLQRLSESFEAWPDVVRFGAVFGSAARGEMRPDSDIDLFVVHDDHIEDSIWEASAHEMTRAVYLWTGNWLSILSMSMAELRERRQRGEALIEEIRRDGLPVRGTRDWFEIQLRRAGSANS